MGASGISAPSLLFFVQVVPHGNDIAVRRLKQGHFRFVLAGYRVGPQIGNTTTSALRSGLQNLVTNWMPVGGVQLAKIAADQAQIVTMGNEALSFSINNKGVKIIPKVLSMQLIDSLEGLLGIFLHRLHDIIEQRFRFSLARTGHVIADREYFVISALKKNPLALLTAVLPILPAIVGMMYGVAWRQGQGFLEALVQVVVERLADVSPNQIGRGSTTGKHNARGIDDIGIELVIHELSLPTERSDSLFAILLIVVDGFAQKRLCAIRLVSVAIFRDALTKYVGNQKHRGNQSDISADR